MGAQHDFESRVGGPVRAEGRKPSADVRRRWAATAIGVVMAGVVFLGCASEAGFEGGQTDSEGNYTPPAGKSFLEDAEDQWQAFDQATRDTVCEGVRLAKRNSQYDAMVAEVSVATGMTAMEVRRFYDQRC